MPPKNSNSSQMPKIFLTTPTKSSQSQQICLRLLRLNFPHYNCRTTGKTQIYLNNVHHNSNAIRQWRNKWSVFSAIHLNIRQPVKRGKHQASSHFPSWASFFHYSIPQIRKFASNLPFTSRAVWVPITKSLGHCFFKYLPISFCILFPTSNAKNKAGEQDSRSQTTSHLPCQQHFSTKEHTPTEEWVVFFFLFSF